MIFSESIIAFCFVKASIFVTTAIMLYGISIRYMYVTDVEIISMFETWLFFVFHFVINILAFDEVICCLLSMHVNSMV